MRTLSILFVALVASISALVACSYDPSLPAVPFLCGSQTPMCPETFQCMDDGAGKMVCVKMGTMPPDADLGSQFQCKNDSNLGSNDTIAGAFTINPAGQPGKTISFADLAICPELDKDTYAVNLTTTQNLEAIATVDSGNPVSVTILTAGGAVAGVPMPMGSASRAYAANLNAGAWYVQVFAGAAVKNNYRLKVTVTP